MRAFFSFLIVFLLLPMGASAQEEGYQELMSFSYARSGPAFAAAAEQYADIFVQEDASCRIVIHNGIGQISMTAEGTADGTIDGEPFAGVGVCQVGGLQGGRAQVALVGVFLFSDGAVELHTPESWAA